jgi:hypothetical protein
MRRRLTRRAPYRCGVCGWRGWQTKPVVETVDGPRGLHRALTDAELEQLEPDKPEGERK